MLSLDPLTIWHLAAELNGLLAQARVSRVQQVAETSWALHFWWAGSHQHHPLRGGRLLLHVSRDKPFCGLLSAPQLAQLPHEARARATGLCMLLRKHLTGAKISRVWAEPGEQALFFGFRQTNELGQAVEPVLVMECMGKHTNLMLVEGETGQAVGGKILGCQNRVTGDMSRLRSVDANLPYELPPRPADKVLISNLAGSTFERLATAVDAKTPQQWRDLLLNEAWGLRRGLLNQLIARHTPSTPGDLLQAVQRLYQPDGSQPTRTVEADGTAGFHLLGPSQSGEALADSLNALLCDLFVAELVEVACTRLRHRLQKPLDSALQQVELELGIVRTHANADGQAAIFQEVADGLMTAYSMKLLPGKGPPGETFTYVNPVTQTEQTIAVEPRFDWPGNAQRYYRQAQRENRRRQLSLAKLETLVDRQAHLQELAVLLAQADSLMALRDLFADWRAAGLAAPNDEPVGGGARAKAGQKDPMAGILKVAGPQGAAIWVGRSGQANAQLCGKLAKAGDWWFHVQEMPGSHVLVKPAEPGPLPAPVIEAAAQLAVHFSTAREGRNVPVVVTQARHVRKIPESWPGHVTYSHESGLFITVDPQELSTLLKAGSSPAEEA